MGNASDRFKWVRKVDGLPAELDLKKGGFYGGRKLYCLLHNVWDTSEIPQ